jgi:hypothetical protein
MQQQDHLQGKEGIGMDIRRASWSGNLTHRRAGSACAEQVSRDFRQYVPQDALRGSLQAEYRGCGKPRCRCRWGPKHGPYHYRYWWEDGRRRKAYVPQRELAQVQAAIERYQQTFPPLWPARRALIALGQIYRAARIERSN